MPVTRSPWRIQPDESIILSFDAKLPGPQIDVEQVNMDFTYSQSFGENLAEAYERLLLDADARRQHPRSAATKPSSPGTVSPTLSKAGRFRKTCSKSATSSSSSRSTKPAPGSLESEDLLARDGHHWKNSKDEFTIRLIQGICLIRALAAGEHMQVLES